MGNIFSELYYGDPNYLKTPIKINEDSKSLVESIFSTKKVKRKTMRVVVSKIQEQLFNGTVSDVIHVNSQNQLGDVFTKNRSCSEKLLKVLEQGAIKEEEGNNS